ncbi:transposase [Rhizobium sp. VS19-DR104.2]|uniref:IS66-like element accessory protein TnpA n=1 Tax=unclassified Rhizobium TaxID=2613769 RepID=UPI001C5AE587|nr:MULTISPECIES: transposase [unclassified Rhizobium]MBZ5763687.1 transposase [Rhizobium sp. VS19-DR96]MBZ5769617.1 transposase [Rhizobium sp. VS19-DR129.2]MBZ5777162.1 transposase [Rhizobium sp. VS19-DRK62.2]MBZ5788301.1 transposase [Rhizobium sp. VS19-DR121]MBZ5805762.1 transposase [Rhizobium sp. VS19-DR181]
MARIEVISGVERRRRWSREAKERILAEAAGAGVRIGDVARRHDIYPAQIRLWRQTFGHVSTPATFLPVKMVEEMRSEQAPVTFPASVAVEILLRNGRSLKVSADLDGRLLSALIVCVEAA